MPLDIIFIIGPQGSGKGTQARILVSRLGFFYWEMGAICREISAQETPLGQKVKELIDQGILLPDEILIEVAKTKLHDIPTDQGVIFDGLTRRVGQTKVFIDFLKRQGRKSFITLFITIPREDSIQRLSKRAQEESRIDDTLEKIELRLKHYEEATIPAIEYSKTRTKFIEIDGCPPVEEVTRAIFKALGLSQ